MPPVLLDVAEWATSLRPQSLPPRVIEGLRLQTLSCLGALYAGLGTQAGRTASRADLGVGQSGPCTLLPSGERVPSSRAVYAHACLSMALDYDDYLPLGHTGHSAVFVALACAEAFGRTLGEALVAQACANELEGRLGAAVVLGPHNGQMWSHIHQPGAALAAGLLLGLDAHRLAHAMAIALYQPPFPLVPGFMGPGSKLTTAATPAMAGLASATLAAGGLEGPLDVVEHPQGFLSRFSYAPLPSFLSGWGSAWLSDALAYKVMPGCAYVDGPIEALFEALAPIGRPVAAAEVRRIRVAATALTVGMDRMARPVGEDGALSPMGVNFSVPYSLGLALAAGRLTGAEFADERFRELSSAARSVAPRVELSLDWEASLDLLAALDAAVGLRQALRSVGSTWPVALARLGAQYREHGIGAGSLAGLGAAALRRLPGWLGAARHAAGGHTLAGRDLSRARMPFSARVEIELADGTRGTGAVRIPCGAPGRPREETRALVREKLVREGGAVLGRDRAESLATGVLEVGLDAPVTPLLARGVAPEPIERR